MAEPSKKRHRIRPNSSETVRQKVEKTRGEATRPRKDKSGRQLVRTIFAPLGSVLRPISWLGGHIVPNYFKQAYTELRNITWPNLKQSRQLTTAVILFAIVFGFLVTVLDYGLDKVFKKVFLKE